MALPGDTKQLNETCSCEWCLNKDNKDVPATIGFCVESDSFGAEWTPICQSCFDEHEKNRHPDGVVGDCEWCRSTEVRVKPFRDWEEGMNGPVYDVCKPCRKKSTERAREELEEYDYYD